LTVGLVNIVREEYHPTTFGVRLTKLLGGYLELADRLPINSKCYEETLLQSMLSGPKTFEDIKAVIQPEAASRTLKRLRSSNLIVTPKERNYIFFFKTIRDPAKETLTTTERKIYDAVAQEGISAPKLAKEEGLSLRRTYKYLRSLRCKKLVFTRRTPKPYDLTCKGKKLALTLQEIEQTIQDASNSSTQVMQDNKAVGLLIAHSTKPIQ